MTGRAPRRLVSALLVVCVGCSQPGVTGVASKVSPKASDSAARQPARPGSSSLLAPPNPSQFLAAIAVETSASLAQDELELLVPRYTGAMLGELTVRDLVLKRGTNGQVRVRSSTRYTASARQVNDAERRCSFVVDCDHAAVQPLLAQLRANTSSPSAAEVIAFVAKFIQHKHMARGFDIASTVAQKREGDCTEHAVLAAALLRATGFPSHIVTGVAIFETEGQVSAFGHAWAEYHDGTHWLLADAASGQALERVVYLPIRLMENEGPGYARELYEGFFLSDIESVTMPITSPVSGR